MLGIRPFGTLVWIGIIVIAIILLYFAGGAVSKQSVTIAGCYREWDTIMHNVQSDLCPEPNVTCKAEPFIMQHNAVVEALLCACTQAAPDYASAEINSQIEKSYTANTNATLAAKEICEGGSLTKWNYRS